MHDARSMLDAHAQCAVNCLFNVVLGNESMGIMTPMTKAELVAPFEAAFAREEDGGCPDPTRGRRALGPAV